MNKLPPAIAAEVERYLRTGETDPHHAAWPGDGFMERANRAHDDLRGALVREVHRLAEGLAHEPLPQVDTVELTRGKVEPQPPSRSRLPEATNEGVRPGR